MMMQWVMKKLDVEKQTCFAENDRDIPASNFSRTPKTNINSKNRWTFYTIIK
jgi:hypothetical protein